MGVKTRDMHVLDLFRCLRWHTLESLVNYHDYLLYHSIVRSGHPANLWLIYDQNKAHQVGYAIWMYPNSNDDPLRAMLNEGAVTRQRTMGNIRRNNETDSTNSQRFRSFIPRSVRLFNRTPMEYKYGGALPWEEFKKKLRLHCMEQVLGPSNEWPNYDEMNGRILSSDKVLFERGEMIVKKKNGLFIEPYVSPYPPPPPPPTSNDTSDGNKTENNNNNNASSQQDGDSSSSSSLSLSLLMVQSPDPRPGLTAVTEIIYQLIDNITDTLTAGVQLDMK